MRTVHFILIFSLLSSTPPLQAEEDYDLYDTRGRRIGEMRSRGSRITVIDELTVDPNAPTVGEGLDSIAEALQHQETIRTLRAAQELLEEQRQEIQRARIQQTIKESGYVYRPQPASREQVEFLISRWYDDALFSKFLDKLTEEELQAFWKVKSDEAIWNELKTEKSLKEFQTEIAQARPVKAQQDAIMAIPPDEFRPHAFKAYTTILAKDALEISPERARGFLMKSWEATKDGSRLILSEIPVDVLDSEDPIQQQAVQFLMHPTYSRHSPSRRETEAEWRKQIAKEVGHLRAFRQQQSQQEAKR